MSYTMTIGMEVYNKCLNNGGFQAMSYQLIGQAAVEAIYMAVIVFIFSNIWGNKKGEQLMKAHTSS